jgi:hypothetical protein
MYFSRITVFLLLSFSTLTLQAQQLVFCEKVEQDGTPVKPADRFILPQGGGSIAVAIRKKSTFGCERITLDIFSVAANSAERFNSSQELIVRPFDYRISARVFFPSPGEFSIYAYDERGRLLGAGKVLLLPRQ